MPAAGLEGADSAPGEAEGEPDSPPCGDEDSPPGLEGGWAVGAAGGDVEGIVGVEEVDDWVDEQPTVNRVVTATRLQIPLSPFLESIDRPLRFILIQASVSDHYAPSAVFSVSKTRTSLLLYCASSPGSRSIELLKTMRRFPLLTAGLLSILLLGDAPSPATEADAELSEEQQAIVEQILALRRQIEDLLELLPQEVRREVERRWQESLPTPVDPEPRDLGNAEPPDEPTATSEETAAATTKPLPEVPETKEERAAAEAPPTALPATADDLPEVAQEAEVKLEEASKPPPCAGFPLFDTNEDLLISGADRQWRFMALWFDENGDGRIDETEIEGLFALGVRQIDVGLRFYGNADSDSEDVDVGDYIWLRQVGSGKRAGGSGVLVIESDRLIRDGRLWLTDEAGVQLTGYQPLGSQAFLETREGERRPLLCDTPPPAP